MYLEPEDCVLDQDGVRRMGRSCLGRHVWCLVAAIEEAGALVGNTGCGMRNVAGVAVAAVLRFFGNGGGYSRV